MAIITFGKRHADPDAIRRIKAWTRQRFALPLDCTLLAVEAACGLPGCPPVETTVVFWTAPDRRHSFKIFKPAAEVIEEDLPPSWLKEALVRDELECC